MQSEETRHPGPVDNRPLKGSFRDDLRRDLKAERDYVLLPQATADMLLDVYGGGPRFRRKVAGNRLLEVDLWPVYVTLYLCNHCHPLPE